MSGRLLDRYTGRAPDATAAEGSPPDAEVAEDLGGFGWLRGIRDRAMMLELRKKSGEKVAIPYGWIERVLLDPPDVITISAGGQKILIKGRNLDKEQGGQAGLYNGITRWKVEWVQEADEPTDLQAPSGATVVKTIEW